MKNIDNFTINYPVSPNQPEGNTQNNAVTERIEGESENTKDNIKKVYFHPFAGRPPKKKNENAEEGEEGTNTKYIDRFVL